MKLLNSLLKKIFHARAEAVSNAYNDDYDNHRCKEGFGGYKFESVSTGSNNQLI